jgi:adenylate kinase
LDKHEAILIIGPTGSGKTPLGDLLNERGLWDRPCAHFDFGRELRRIARDGDPLFEPDEVDFIREILTKGRLLENEHFHIAEKILKTFIAERQTGHDDLTVLNGLPRHIGQAADIDRIIYVRAVIHLKCTPEVVVHRIQTNAGGDREHRTDDALAAVCNKLTLFEERTKPLIDHYIDLGATVMEVDVESDGRPVSLLEYMEILDLPRWQPDEE